MTATLRLIAFTMVALLALTLSTVISGCGDSEATGKPMIGFSVYDMKAEFFQSMEKGVRERAVELGYDYKLHDQKSDELQMVSGCRSLISQGVKALIVSPVKPDALGPIVDSSQKAGIPIVISDIGGGGTNYNAIVISDNQGGGKLAGEFVVKRLGAGEQRPVAIIKVEPSATYAIRRGEGFKAAVTAGGFTVAAELSGHSKTEEGYAKMKNILAANPNLVAVFCENDPMAVGAAQAVSEAGLSNKILVIGFNADGVAIDAIRAGTMTATVAQYPEKMGRLSAELVDAKIKGTPIKFSNEKEREVFAPVELITAENLPPKKEK
jgi:ribose transport system substrate-binding protein